MNFRNFFGLFLTIVVIITSCKKQNDSFSSAPLSDYFPLQVGKYITYNLDSFVYINFGKKDTVRKYQVKDSVAEQIVDNLGRKGFRILRLIRKNALESWSPDNSFFAVPTAGTIELIQNNLRFIKLVSPINNGFSWKGNRYLPSEIDPSYEFASAFMEDWDYTYQDVNTPLMIGTTRFDSTITVAEIDETQGDPAVTQYADKTYSIEKYAKGIGLIYREFLHWEYQSGNRAYKGYGEKMTIIDHN
ncbi:hypothetical protein BH09BAC2_BH09BAC2_08690 [soil metagenome]